LANLDLWIERDQFVGFHPMPQSINGRRINCRQAISELDKTADTGSMLNAAPFSDVIELRKKIARKHSLHEPNRASPGQLAHPQPWSETGNLVLFPQTNSGEVFAFGLGSETKPKWPIGGQKLRLRLRHSRAWFPSIPTKERDLFNSSSFCWHPAELDFSRRGGRYLNL
jgi:hypothetical protein